MPSLLPIDCLLGGINFMHTLIIQTAGPLLVIAILKCISACLYASSGKAAELHEQGKGPQPTGIFLAELCSTVSFFLLFLLYPGSSTKIFNALLCVSFNGEGEDGQSFLRVDFSIDCQSAVYRGFIFPYAMAMCFVYPVGVPLYYSLLLFKNKQELNSLRHVELSILNEKTRADLGEHMVGRARRDYQPEIDEAVERRGLLEELYDRKRNALPGNLKKLTNGYEMRTYWFEIFECTRKILLVLVPIFFEQDSPEQLTMGLIICFVTFGAYMMVRALQLSGSPLVSRRTAHLQHRYHVFLTLFQPSRLTLLKRSASSTAVRTL